MATHVTKQIWDESSILTPVEIESKTDYTKIVLPILGLLVIGMICCLSPDVQRWIAHAFSYIQTGEMSLRSAIVIIAIPSIAATLMIGSIVLLVKRHKRRLNQTIQIGGCADQLQTIQASCSESKKHWLVGAIMVASLIASTCALWHIPAFQNLINHPIKIWQGIALGGCGIAFTGSILAIINGPGTTHEIMDIQEPDATERELIDSLLNSRHTSISSSK